MLFDQAACCSDLLQLQLHCSGADAASALSRLWKQSAHAKLLPRPPAEQTNSKHAVVLEQSFCQITKLSAASNGVLLQQLLQQTRQPVKSSCVHRQAVARTTSGNTCSAAGVAAAAAGAAAAA
jgi:hypothetical protein